MINASGYTPIPLPTNNINFTPPQTVQSSLELRQLQDYKIADEFKDGGGNQWKLVKSAYDSSVDIPDPNYVQVVDYWMHEFIGSNGKVFVYCVQGIKRPRIDTEKSVQIMYQWFSTKNEPKFNPMMISQNEWCKANIYTAPLYDTRVSILNAFCGINDKQNDDVDDIPLNLISGAGNGRKNKQG